MSITIGKSRFAKTESEFLESLFQEGATCDGYYQVNNQSITLKDHNRIKIGVVNKEGLLCKATQLDGGKWWYSFAEIDCIGRLTFAEQKTIQSLHRDLCPKILLDEKGEGKWSVRYNGETIPGLIIGGNSNFQNQLGGVSIGNHSSKVKAKNQLVELFKATT